MTDKNKIVPFTASKDGADDVQDSPQSPIDISKFPKVRNREQVRAFKKVLRKAGHSQDSIDNLIKLSKTLAQAEDTETAIKSKEYLAEGEQVKLNVDKMYGHPDWDVYQDAYKAFVDDNIDTIFAVKYVEPYLAKPSIVSLVCPLGITSPWLFADVDLLVKDSIDGQFKELWMIEEVGNH